MIARPSRSELTAAAIRHAEEHPVRSRHHKWRPSQQRQYNSLTRRGRTLYDNLRTQFDWSHSEAYLAAKAAHGEKAEPA